jgi:hypothetical protein
LIRVPLERAHHHRRAIPARARRPRPASVPAEPAIAVVGRERHARRPAQRRPRGALARPAGPARGERRGASRASRSARPARQVGLIRVRDARIARPAAPVRTVARAARLPARPLHADLPAPAWPAARPVGCVARLRAHGARAARRRPRLALVPIRVALRAGRARFAGPRDAYSGLTAGRGARRARRRVRSLVRARRLSVRARSDATHVAWVARWRAARPNRAWRAHAAIAVVGAAA